MSSTTPKSLLLSKEDYKTKAVYRKARVFSTAKAQKKYKEKLQKEQEEATAKERRAAFTRSYYLCKEGLEGTTNGL